MPNPKDDLVFMAAVTQVLLDEGGAKITDDPQDRGGRTKYGITQKLLNAISVTVIPRKVDDLDENDAVAIYYQHFWLEYKFDVMAALHPALATKMFNFCVTAGPKAATICLQRALRACGLPVKEDGVLGAITRGEMSNYLLLPDNRVQMACLLVAYKCEIAGYYRDLDQPRFEAGWTARAYR